MEDDKVFMPWSFPAKGRPDDGSKKSRKASEKKTRDWVPPKDVDLEKFPEYYLG